MLWAWLAAAALASGPVDLAAAQTAAAATTTPGASPVYEEGEALCRAKDYAGALAKFRLDADQRGHAPAQFRVGQFALAGLGTPRNATSPRRRTT